MTKAKSGGKNLEINAFLHNLLFFLPPDYVIALSTSLSSACSNNNCCGLEILTQNSLKIE